MSLASYTRELVITEVKRQLQDRLGALFTTTDLNRWCDLAVLDITSKTRCLRTEATANTVSAQGGYTIPEDCIGGWAVSRLDYEGEPLEMVPWDQMQTKVQPGMVLSSSGTPRYWSPYGRTFRLFPIPNTSNKELRVWYANLSEAFSADTVALTDLGIPETYGPAMETFMRARGYILAGDEPRAAKAYELYLMQVGHAHDKNVPDVPEGTRGAG